MRVIELERGSTTGIGWQATGPYNFWWYRYALWRLVSAPYLLKWPTPTCFFATFCARAYMSYSQLSLSLPRLPNTTPQGQIAITTSVINFLFPLSCKDLILGPGSFSALVPHCIFYCSFLLSMPFVNTDVRCMARCQRLSDRLYHAYHASPGPFPPPPRNFR